MKRIRYRPGAPGGTRRRAIAMRDPRKHWLKKGGNEEENSKMRDLRKLPASIRDGGVD
jgi:hypothetical protein